MGTYDGHMDLVVGRGGWLTAHGDGVLGGEVPHHVQTPQFIADVLNRHALKYARTDTHTHKNAEVNLKHTRQH